MVAIGGSPVELVLHLDAADAAARRARPVPLLTDIALRGDEPPRRAARVGVTRHAGPHPREAEAAGLESISRAPVTGPCRSGAGAEAVVGAHRALCRVDRPDPPALREPEPDGWRAG
ncbi:hypothetical protein SLH32_34145 [Streptomyces sp. KHY 26]|nr:hypothetical protein [Streptomyces hygroscopicus]